MWCSRGACDVCGWQFIRGHDEVWCRCTVERRRDAVTDGKLRAFMREWDQLAEESSRRDQERQAQGEPPLGSLIIFAPRP